MLGKADLHILSLRTRRRQSRRFRTGNGPADCSQQRPSDFCRRKICSPGHREGLRPSPGEVALRVLSMRTVNGANLCAAHQQDSARRKDAKTPGQNDRSFRNSA